MQALLDWGVGLIFYIQTTFTGLTDFFNFFTSLGDENFYLLAFPLLYWTVESKLRLRVGIFFAVSVVLNDVLKIALHQPRPFWVSTRVQLLTNPSSSFGLPSGHAQNAVVFWGTIAAHYKRTVGWIIALAFMLLIGISRIYLGVHFPHDTLLGWAVGAAILYYLLRNENTFVAWFQQLTTQNQLRTILFASLVGIALGLLVLAGVSGVWEVPADWVNQAAIQAPDEPLEPLSAAGVITIMATLAGLLYGHVWLSVRGGFDPGGPIGLKIGRFILGLIGVILIWAGLDAAFSAIAADETILGYILRYFRYGSVGLWIGLFAPMLFIRLGLAQSAK